MYCFYVELENENLAGMPLVDLCIPFRNRAGGFPTGRQGTCQM